jgi:DNA replication protein DnaC
MIAFLSPSSSDPDPAFEPTRPAENRLLAASVWPRIQRQLQAAGLPVVYQGCSFATLEPEPNVAAFRLAQTYAETGAYQGQRGLLLRGRTGRGKTALAVAILRQWVKQTHGQQSVRFVRMPQVLNRPPEGWGLENAVGLSRQGLRNHSLVVLDDLGRQPLPEPLQASFYALLDGLWEESRQVVITTPRSLDAWRKGLDEGLVARVLEQCHRVVLHGKDRRL